MCKYNQTTGWNHLFLINGCCHCCIKDTLACWCKLVMCRIKGYMGRSDKGLKGDKGCGEDKGQMRQRDRIYLELTIMYLRQWLKVTADDVACKHLWSIATPQPVYQSSQVLCDLGVISQNWNRRHSIYQLTSPPVGVRVRDEALAVHNTGLIPHCMWEIVEVQHRGSTASFFIEERDY